MVIIKQKQLSIDIKLVEKDNNLDDPHLLGNIYNNNNNKKKKNKKKRCSPVRQSLMGARIFFFYFSLRNLFLIIYIF